MWDDLDPLELRIETEWLPNAMWAVTVLHVPTGNTYRHQAASEWTARSLALSAAAQSLASVPRWW